MKRRKFITNIVSDVTTSEPNIQYTGSERYSDVTTNESNIQDTYSQNNEPESYIQSQPIEQVNTTYPYKPSVFFVTHQKRLDRIFNNYGYVKVLDNMIPYNIYTSSVLRDNELKRGGVTKIGFRNCVILEIDMEEQPENSKYKVKIVYSGSPTGKKKYKYISEIEGDLNPELYIDSNVTNLVNYSRLFLCRHGEGVHNTLGMIGKVYQSRNVWDADLTDIGIEDAGKAGEEFNKYLLKHNIKDLVVGTSYLRRTMLTFGYMYDRFNNDVKIKNNTMYVVPCINEIGSGLENIRSIVKVKSISELNKNIKNNLNINWDFFDRTKGKWVRKDKDTGAICPNPLYIAVELMKYIETTQGGTMRKRITRKNALGRKIRRTRKTLTRKRKTQQKRNHNKNRRMTRKNI
jgi:hypothetical protein